MPRKAGSAEHLLIAPHPPQHLGRGVSKGPKEPGCCGEMGLGHDARKTDIANLGTGAILVEEDILGLQVTVHHLRMHRLAVRGRQTLRCHVEGRQMTWQW